jgi:hypothetical protein
LDHERREMSEKRETVNAAMDQAIPRLAGNIVTGRVEDSILFPKKFAQSANFLGKTKKSTMLPQASLPFIQVNTWFETDHIRYVNNTASFKGAITGRM